MLSYVLFSSFSPVKTHRVDNFLALYCLFVCRLARLIASSHCCHGNKITSCFWGHGNSANQCCCRGEKRSWPFFWLWIFIMLNILKSIYKPLCIRRNMKMCPVMWYHLKHNGMMITYVLISTEDNIRNLSFSELKPDERMLGHMCCKTNKL